MIRMTHIQKVMTGWRRIRNEPGTQSRQALRVLDYAATSFKPTGTWLASLRFKTWHKQKTGLEQLSWRETNTQGLVYEHCCSSDPNPNLTAFAFGQTIIDFNEFNRFAVDPDDPNEQRVTKSIPFMGHKVALIFTFIKEKKLPQLIDGILMEPSPQYLVRTYIDLVVSKTATGKKVIETANLPNAGIYRLELGGQSLYFGEPNLLRRLLIDDKKKPAFSFTPNQVKFPVGGRFRVVLVDPDGNKIIIGDRNAVLELMIKGEKHSLEFKHFTVGQDRSTKDHAQVTWPNYFISVKKQGSNDAFEKIVLASNINQLVINDQRLFLYAEPL